MPRPLSHLPRGRVARVRGFDPAPAQAPSVGILRDKGFCEGDEVEILAFGPLGATPLCVRLDRRMIGLRADEAACVLVDDDQPATSGRDEPRHD